VLAVGYIYVEYAAASGVRSGIHAGNGAAADARFGSAGGFAENIHAVADAEFAFGNLNRIARVAYGGNHARTLHGGIIRAGQINNFTRVDEFVVIQIVSIVRGCGNSIHAVGFDVKNRAVTIGENLNAVARSTENAADNAGLRSAYASGKAEAVRNRARCCLIGVIRCGNGRLEHRVPDIIEQNAQNRKDHQKYQPFDQSSEKPFFFLFAMGKTSVISDNTNYTLRPLLFLSVSGLNSKHFS